MAWGVGVVLYLGFVAFATLAPTPWATQGAQPHRGILDPEMWADPVTWTSGSPREFMLNVMLFVPVGLLAARFGVVRGFAASVALTFAIEVLQIPMPDRISDPRDLVANAAGAAFGVAVVASARRSALPSQP